ncbi:glycosyltransferase family 2 protein [Roseivirga sp.]|uniref:glycosyltransferase family 2 protein n=1 Tax=Roseivirga sp. TaxID=1964215 RepID=UPI003B52E635
MKQPLVSIITVNYKQRLVTGELLKSISQLDYPNLEVIVVDNGQKENDSAYYHSILPEVRVLNSEVNLGFAGGNNVGMMVAEGDYLFLVNNDTELENGLIESLVSRFTEPEIGAVSPVLRYFDHPEKIQFAGFTKINSLTGRNETFRAIQKTEPYDTPYFHGAAVMIRKEVAKATDYMPEEFFLYYEELEWSYRIRQHGYRILVDPDVSVLHKESISTGKNSPLKVYYQNRNRVHFMRTKSAGGWFMFLTFFVLVSIPKNICARIIHQEPKHLKAFIKAVKDGLIFKKYGFRPI